MKIFRNFFFLILFLPCLSSYSMQRDGKESSVRSLRDKGSYPCFLCNKVFTFDTNRIRHRVSQHEGRRYYCKVCGHLEKDSGCAKKHVINSHDIPGVQARSMLYRVTLGSDGKLYNKKQCKPREISRKRENFFLPNTIMPAPENKKQRVEPDRIKVLLLAANCVLVTSIKDDLD